MTAPLIVGVPSAAHREALLRETAGGGRVPVMLQAHRPGREWEPVPAWIAPDRRFPAPPSALRALILSHPDPEAGAMGLARLAWVAGSVVDRPMVYRSPGAWLWFPDEQHPKRLGLVNRQGQVASEWSLRSRLLSAAVAEDGDVDRPYAIGLVCVHLGLLERVERVEVPHGG